MSQFDARARAMEADFGSTDDAPWSAVAETTDLSAVNPPDATGAKTSLRLDLSGADRADSTQFNKILMEWAKSHKPSTESPGRP